ncbi:uncharacterized protein LOC142588763 [Dermacentor variabilis]|uniref:uncharacterized protein LOC142588763 n=1 Tax=Dermacentor variabilis TaxID=34621 RepID=UPI003F5C7A89
MPDPFTCKALPTNAWKSPDKATSELACEQQDVELLKERTMAGISSVRGTTYFYTYETAHTLKSKAELTMSSKDREHKFSWLLLNVHLTDVTKRCFTGGPFERLKEFRKFYYEYSQKFVSG